MPDRSPIDIDRVRRMALDGQMDTEIARELGVHVMRVGRLRRRHGIPPAMKQGRNHLQRTKAKQSLAAYKRWESPQYSSADADKIRLTKSLGATDEEIGSQVGGSSYQISRFRRLKGIACLPRREQVLLRPEWRYRLQNNGRVNKDKMAATKIRNRKARNALFGLPEWIMTKQLKIIFAMVGGPKTLSDLIAFTGSNPKSKYASFNASKPSRNLLGELVQKGLVVMIPKWGNRGDGRRVRISNLYALTMTTINMLSNSKEAV